MQRGDGQPGDGDQERPLRHAHRQGQAGRGHGGRHVRRRPGA